MNRYTFEFFDHVKWAYREAVVVATHIEQAEQLLRAEPGIYISDTPYRQPPVTSLKLTREEPYPTTPHVESIWLVASRR